MNTTYTCATSSTIGQSEIREGLETMLRIFKQDKCCRCLCDVLEASWSANKRMFAKYLKICISKVDYHEYGFRAFFTPPDMPSKRYDSYSGSGWFSNNKFRRLLLQDLINHIDRGELFCENTIQCYMEQYKDNLPELERRMVEMT